MSTTIMAAAKAQTFVEKECLGDGVTGVATEWPSGIEGVGDPVIVVYVDAKRPKAACGRPVKKTVDAFVDSVKHTVKTEVREVGEGGFRTMDLRPSDYSSLAATGYDLIYNKIVGGLQIQPYGANWVGTLGGIFMATINGQTVYGGLTNAHVTGLHPEPRKLMMQPSSSFESGGFGRVAWVSPFSKNNDNLVDAAVIDCHATEGRWENNERWTVHPDQFSGLKLSLKTKDPKVGMRVVKFGRTTGEVHGVCTAVNATDFVNYGEDGVFGFIKQAHFKGDNGDLSGPGDSGSFIIEEGTNDVVAHLFAGGGGVTIGYYISHLLTMVNGRLAENPPNTRREDNVYSGHLAM